MSCRELFRRGAAPLPNWNCTATQELSIGRITCQAARIARDGLPRLPKLPFGELALGLPRIYAIAYDQSAEARRFYAFQKALETYERTVAAETILALSTDNELYRLGKEGG